MQTDEGFTVGDHVRMTVGGPVMTVDGTRADGKIICAWFEGERPRSRECWPSQLIYADSVNKSATDDDELGLLRKAAFNRDIAVDVVDVARTHDPLALIMVDLDKFKSINDTYGHSIGDEVLQSVAESIKKATGIKGRSYRYGGEELAILLPNCVADEAAALAERIRKDVEASVITDRSIKVTASFGVADIPGHAATVAELIAAADAALYQAKSLGRNLVRVSGDNALDTSNLPAVRIKQPTGNSLTEKQLQEIRSYYFRFGHARCPRDESVLRVQELQSDEKVIPELIVACPLCGLNERIKVIAA
jgi:diguanylate cyclase (GGDEF)-like protein